MKRLILLPREESTFRAHQFRGVLLQKAVVADTEMLYSPWGRTLEKVGDSVLSKQRPVSRVECAFGASIDAIRPDIVDVTLDVKALPSCA